MNAAKIAARFCETFYGCTAAAVEHDGEWYIVTDETGDGCFAYAVDEAVCGLDAVDDATDAGLAEDVAPYQVYCDHASPEDDERLALAVLRDIGKRICHAGSCDRVDLPYTYSIFDSQPAQGGDAWPSANGVEFFADGDDDAVAHVEDKLSDAACECEGVDGYAEGDRLFATIWDADGQIVGRPSIVLGGEDFE